MVSKAFGLNQAMKILLVFITVLLWSGARAGVVAEWGTGPVVQPWNATNLTRVAAGGAHVVAVRSDGAAVAWGDNSYGQANVPGGLSNLVDVAAGMWFSLGLRADGTVVGWGGNVYGEQRMPAGLSNVVSVVARQFHGLALRADGTAAAWGYNGYGEGSIPEGLSNVTSLAAGYFHNLALKADGTIVAWGNNNSGQTNVPPSLTDITAVAGGAQFSMALTSAGRVIAWGDNSFHQTNVPAGLSGVIAIAAGVYHAVALCADGTVVAWGEYSAGETNIPPNLSNATAVAAGDYFSLAITEDGPVQILTNPRSQTIAWDSNAVFEVTAVGTPPLTFQWLFNGQPLTNSAVYSGVTSQSLSISNARFRQRGTYSVLVQSPMSEVLSREAALDVVGVAELSLEPGDVTLGAGDSATFIANALGPPPLVYQWAFNGIPLPSETNTSLRLPDVQASNAGVYSVAVSNPYGTSRQQLTLTVIDRAPVNDYLIRQTIGNSMIVPMNSSAKLTAAARGSEPMAFQWWLDGDQIAGETNPVLSIPRMTPDKNGSYSVTVSNAFGGLTSQKAPLWAVEVFPWTPGYGGPFFGPPPPVGLSNISGLAVGDAHLITCSINGSVLVWPFAWAASVVTNVPYGLGRVVGVAAGDDFSLVLNEKGTIRGWGLGAGAQVPASLNGVEQVVAGGSHAAALRTNGTVAIWGFGYGSATNQVAAITNAIAVAVGRYHGMALLADGTVKVWGQATELPNLGGVAGIAAGDGTCLALKQDGTVVGWNSASARPPAGLSNVVAIAAGGQNNLALLADGTLRDWGGAAWPPSIARQLSNIVDIASGESSHAARIGDGSPAFTLQPRNQASEHGGVLNLRAMVVGVQPMSYQWFHEGSPLAGGTNSSLTMSNVMGPEIGDYELVAFNVLGRATSVVASLSIPYRGTLGEALNSPALPWTNGAPAHPWVGEYGISHDGEAAVQSAMLSDSQFSILQTSVYGPGALSFWWKVSSEEGFDFLSFWDAGSLQMEISGEQDWHEIKFRLSSGFHDLKWMYQKDPSVSYGQDAGWVDQVVFQPDPPTITQQPATQTVWAGTNVTLQVRADGAPPLSYQWFFDGAPLSAGTVDTLILTNVSRHDSGGYYLTVANAAGAIASSNALVTVLVAQQLTAPGWGPNGVFMFSSGDTDGNPLTALDLPGFEVQATSNLVDWVSLPGALMVTNGLLQVMDPAATNLSHRFYRVIERR